ncbi:MAG: Glu/Leu/Phe/Val dehydrogenase dimerization domain-containing protein [Dongiaceae bacterium]
MNVFSAPDFNGHEQVVFCHDPTSGLKAIIAIHNTWCGPSLGGCRMWNYHDESQALTDVLRLSRGMTYKNAMANLPLGGGKSVIIGDSKRDKTPALMQAMGHFVDRLGGLYIIAEDVGTSPADIDEMRKHTDHVAGLSDISGDPSPITAHGVFHGILASARYAFKTDNLKGVKVAVQGLGHVGYYVCKFLHEAGAQLIVTDIDAQNLEKVVKDFGAKPVHPSLIYDQDVDIFSPCALGAVINDDTLRRLKAKIVAGAANNQLAEVRHGEEIMRKGILYAPDYVINAGGVINVYHERFMPKYNKAAALAHVEKIADTLKDVFERAAAEKISTSLAADRLAEQRFHSCPLKDSNGPKGAAA